MPWPSVAILSVSAFSYAYSPDKTRGDAPRWLCKIKRGAAARREIGETLKRGAAARREHGGRRGAGRDAAGLDASTLR